MSVDLGKKLKVALDESRLLILGAQVIFGLQFESAFQENFAGLSDVSKVLLPIAACSMVLCMALLIFPSLYHQMAKYGESNRGSIRAATVSTSVAILPMLLALSLSAFVIITMRSEALLGEL